MINTSKFVLAGKTGSCHSCQKKTDLALLDGKDDGSGNCNILECPDCYGPGWRPMGFKEGVSEAEVAAIEASLDDQLARRQRRRAKP